MNRAFERRQTTLTKLALALMLAGMVPIVATYFAKEPRDDALLFAIGATLYAMALVVSRYQVWRYAEKTVPPEPEDG